MNDKNDQAASRRWMIWLLLLWLAAAVWLVVQKWAAIKGLGLPDTDDNMRLQQVRDWLGGQGWFDLRQHRLSPPVGIDIHWSRLVDLPLAGMILALKPLTSDAFAERVAVTIAPLLPLGVIIATLAFIGRRLIDPRAWFIGPALLMFAYATLAMVTPLRIDHHGWQLALMMVMVSGLMMDRRALGGAISGVALGLSLTIGIELLPYLGLTALMIALFWVWDRQEAPRAAAFGAAAAGATALGLLIFVPPGARATGICDALSYAHVEALAIGGAGLVLLAFLPLESRLARLLATLALGGVVAAFTWRVNPQCLGDPYSLIDPDARHLWLANVREARPIYQQSMEIQIGSLSLPVVGVAGFLLALWHSRGDALRLRRWAAISGLGLCGLGFCFFQTRAAAPAQVLGIPGAAMLAWVLIQIAERLRPPWRTIAVPAVFLLASGLCFQLIGKAIPVKPPGPAVRKAGAANKGCARLTALQPLNAIPAGTMFTLIDLSPRLIVATHHSGITGPYHRNGKAIADVMKAFGGTDDQAHGLVLRHRADYVLICPGVGEATIYARRAPKGFYSELAAGRAPDWLQRVPLTGGTPYMLWKVKS